MVHLAFPSMTGHEWIEEGLATYVEPLARARAGLIPPDEIWRWLLWGLPKGIEGIGRRGLDEARSWGGDVLGRRGLLLPRRRRDPRSAPATGSRSTTRCGGS